MRTNILEIEIEALDEYVPLGVERVIKTRATNAHRVKQFRHTGTLEAALPRRSAGLVTAGGRVVVQRFLATQPIY